MIMMALMTRCPFKVMKETGGALCVAERAGSGIQDSAKHKKTLVVKNNHDNCTLCGSGHFTVLDRKLV